MTISQDFAAPLIVVVGATGTQGGSVVDNLAASDKPYRIRGLTRDSTKKQATSLAERGVEVVQCNLTVDNIEGIRKAFEGATYVFIVTNFWEHLDGARERAEGKAMVDCAKAVGVKLLLISGLVSVTEASHGELTRVFHFDAKHDIVQHARSVGVPYVDVQASAYMSNIVTFMRPAPLGDDSGTYVVRGTWTPGAKLPYVDTRHDYGLFVRLAVESDEFNGGDGEALSAWSEWVSFEDLCRTVSEVSGKTVAYQRVTEEQARAGMAQGGMPPHAVDDYIDMSKFHEFVWPRVFVETDLSKLARRPRTFEEYAKTIDWSSVLP
ncbi:hypothetical protein Hte_002777 [Hypoxylon texense]